MTIRSGISPSVQQQIPLVLPCHGRFDVNRDELEAAPEATAFSDCEGVICRRRLGQEITDPVHRQRSRDLEDR